MAYAASEDMIARFGEVDLIRLSAPEGQLDGVIDFARVELALDSASALIDSYVRRRYAVPLSPVPQEIADACCTLARYDLARGEQKTPSEQMIAERREILAWLSKIADGMVLLAATLAAATAPSIAGARVSDRARDFAPGPGLP